MDAPSLCPRAPHWLNGLQGDNADVWRDPAFTMLVLALNCPGQTIPCSGFVSCSSSDMRFTFTRR